MTSDLEGGVGGRKLPVRERAVSDDEWLTGGSPFQRWAMTELRAFAGDLGRGADVRHEVSTEYQYIYFGEPRRGNPCQIKWYFQTPNGEHLRFYLTKARPNERILLTTRLSPRGRASCNNTKSKGYGFNAYVKEDIELVKGLIRTRLGFES